TLKFLLLILVIGFITYLFVLNENPVVLNLFNRLEIMFEPNQGGTVRLDQFNYFLTLFKNPSDYIFGLSKPIVNISALSYGVEIEPFNIFVLYGLLGFLLQYGLVIYISIYLLRYMRYFRDDNMVLTLIVSSFV